MAIDRGSSSESSTSRKVEGSRKDGSRKDGSRKDDDNDEGPVRDLSGFGAYVYELMARQSMHKQVELRFVVRSRGREASAQNISSWLRGTMPPPWFVQILEEELARTEEERSELRRRYVWESRRGA